MKAKPIYKNRMYLLPDGRHFLVLLPASHRKTCYVGKVIDINREPDEEGVVPLRNKAVLSEVLRRSKLVPKGEEPWGFAPIPKGHRQPRAKT